MGKRVLKRPEDPVHEYGGKWWFWPDTGKERIGPYDTEGGARRALDRWKPKASKPVWGR